MTTSVETLIVDESNIARPQVKIKNYMKLMALGEKSVFFRNEYPDRLSNHKRSATHTHTYILDQH